jgi:hypothetical protein
VKALALAGEDLKLCSRGNEEDVRAPRQCRQGHLGRSITYALAREQWTPRGAGCCHGTRPSRRPHYFGRCAPFCWCPRSGFNS